MSFNQQVLVPDLGSGSESVERPMPLRKPK
jgi:hypothetical protein